MITMSIKEKISEKSIALKAIISTVAGLFGLYKVTKDAGLTGLWWPGFSVLFIAALIMAGCSTFSLIKSDGDKSKKIFKYAFIFGTLFGIATDMGYQFTVSEMTAPGLKGKALIILTGLGLSVVCLPVTYRIFRLAEGLYQIKTSEFKIKKPGILIFISWAILELSWFPAFLAYYPAILSYDINRQLNEAAKGYVWFYEYQPLAHTFLIRQFYLLGINLGDPAKGMAIFALLQSMLLAFSISLILYYVYIKTGKAPAVFWLVCFALLPFNPVLAVSMTKDIIFTAFFAFILLLIERMVRKPSVWVYVLFFLTGIINILFRSNAMYALIFLVPAFFMMEKTMKKRILMAALALVMVIAGVGSKILIRTSMDAIAGASIEMYSVPIMQMVRVVKYQEQNLTPEQSEILHYYIADESWGVYNAPIADSFKSIASRDRNAEWTENHARLLKDYLKIGIAYPNDYFDAFLGLTIGYWFTDDRSHAEMLGVGDDSDLGLLYTFNASVTEAVPDGIPSRSYLPKVEAWYSHVVNGNAYYNWPIVSQLMKPAVYFWLFVLSIFVCIYKKKKEGIALFAYPVFYMLTMLLGPCVNFRYMYPFIVAVPMLIAFVFSKTEEVK